MWKENNYPNVKEWIQDMSYPLLKSLCSTNEMVVQCTALGVRFNDKLND